MTALQGPLRTLWRTTQRSIAAVASILGLLGLGAGLMPAFAQALQAVPALTARVIDQTATLSPEQRQALEAKLQAFEQNRGTQIVVLLVPTTAPEEIADYTQRVGEAWKIGRRNVGDGLLVVIAKNDRTLRIAPAKTLEGAVPDLAAKQVIDQVMVPRLREGDFAGGISAGLDQLMARISGEALPPAQESSHPGGLDPLVVLVLLLFGVPTPTRLLALWLGRKPAALVSAGLAGALSWMLGASPLLSLLVLAVAALIGLVATHLKPSAGSGRSGWGGWGHSGGGSSWSGGGFRSGGGGDFGGGGASGRW